MAKLFFTKNVYCTMSGATGGVISLSQKRSKRILITPVAKIVIASSMPNRSETPFYVAIYILVIF
jgi:hypothetical protein